MAEVKTGKQVRRVMAALATIAAFLAGFAGVGFLIFGLPAMRHRQEAEKIRPQAMHDVMRQAQPLIRAVEAYRAKEGRPPERLEQLVPRYLPQIPPPGPMSKTGEWLYRTDGDWMAIGVFVEKKFSPQYWGFGDVFVYHSNGKYPYRSYGGIMTERVGDWAYYYE